jgi:phospholipid/cholesterol/gamma-HCH transport system substrate-binding protein
MRSHGREFIVGIVFFLLLGALGVITFALDNDAFRSTEKVTFRFDDVAGLTTGSEVWLNGLPSGTVKEISIAPDGTVSATAHMRHKLGDLDLSKGVAVEVKDKSSLGGAIIAITTSRVANPKLPKTAADAASRVWSAKAGGLAAVGETVVDKFVKASDDSPAFLGKALVGPQGIEDFNAAIKDLRDTVASIKTWSKEVDEGKGTLGLLIKDQETRDNVKGFIADARELTRKANAGEGLLGKLLNDPETSKKFDRILDGLDTFSAGLKNKDGSLYKFMNDGSLFDDAKVAVADIRKFSEGMNDPNGTVYRLMHDGKLADDLSAAASSAKLSFDDLHGVVADIKAGKGTLGKLATDPALYDDLRETLGVLKRSFEEARENAPILTFAGFLFRTF